MAQLEVLNPVALAEEKSIPPAARVKDLAGKRVGLYWNMKSGGDLALDRVEKLLKERFPGITAKRYIGSVGFMMRHLTPDDAEKIAGQCDVVVGTTND
ncbi:MAG: hypothetical protein JRH18_00805 [Deltaproteobacteria bacterium]|nr:hypothetical protein [Deltaproteobacteria bacterium]MBW1959958.1 hypothetical protein [Deltaproteobacteria bacterium]MBW1994125.1 hypothetical protein [Deltaproteobacteria bacterium]MBW2150186.1 hypothetical protein [Deltaproteobacteria bacterium]